MGLLLFKKKFLEPIRRGQKRMTLRRWDRPRVTAGRRAFCPGLGYLQIQTIEPVDWADLNEADALADGFASLPAMRATLLSIYPTRDDGKRWWRIRFEWVRPDGWREESVLFDEDAVDNEDQ